MRATGKMQYTDGLMLLYNMDIASYEINIRFIYKYYNNNTETVNANS